MLSVRRRNLMQSSHGAVVAAAYTFSPPQHTLSPSDRRAHANKQTHLTRRRHKAVLGPHEDHAGVRCEGCHGFGDSSQARANHHPADDVKHVAYASRFLLLLLLLSSLSSLLLLPRRPTTQASDRPTKDIDAAHVLNTCTCRKTSQTPTMLYPNTHTNHTPSSLSFALQVRCATTNHGRRQRQQQQSFV